MFYLDLFASLAHHGVEYVVIGGLAVSLHGVERTTMDIDVAVAMSPENLTALVEVARELAMVPVLPVGLEVLIDIDQLTRWHRDRHLEVFALQAPGTVGVTLDVLLFPPVAFADMYDRALNFKVAEVPVVVASIEDLIALKQAVGRPIDLADIDHLQRLRGG
jgi:predicted nucleotidyltransferase